MAQGVSCLRRDWDLGPGRRGGDWVHAVADQGDRGESVGVGTPVPRSAPDQLRGGSWRAAGQAPVKRGRRDGSQSYSTCRYTTVLKKE